MKNNEETMLHILSILVLMTGMSGTMFAKGSQSLSDRMPAVLSRMESSQLAVRESALNDLCELARNESGQLQGTNCPTALSGFLKQHPEQIEATTVALIKSLTTDNSIFMDENTAAGTYTEADSDHYATLIDIVASLNDERSIPSLVGAITTGGLAEQGLLKYGRKAIEPLLVQLRTGTSPTVRSESLATVVTLLLRENDADSHSQIVGLIQSGLQDKEFLVRMAAIQAIERLEDGNSFVPKLRLLAEHDPLRIDGQGEGGADDYPVRREADRVLQKILKTGQPHGENDVSH
jgi:HEAT repeat protein